MSSCSSTATEENGRKPQKKRQKEEPNTGITRGGIQEGTLSHISDSSGFAFYHACIRSFPVVAFFMGEWCGPAREVSDLVIKLSDKYLTLTFLKIELPLDNKQSELFEFVKGFNIRQLPTVLFFYGGKEVFRLVGAFPDELKHLTHSLYMRQMQCSV